VYKSHGRHGRVIVYYHGQADSDTYQQYHVGFWGTRYDINPIISAGIGADMDDFANIDAWYC